MRILHLINDHQVIERTLGVYEELFPNMNEVLLFNKTKETKYLEKYASCTLVNFWNLKKIAKAYDFSGITYVIAHYMTMDKIDFIKYVPDNIHVCWEVYGFDLYNQFLVPNGYQISYTDELLYHPYSFSLRYFPLLVKIELLFKGHKYSFDWQKNRQFKYISNRVDSIQYCCKYDAQYIEEFAHRQIKSYETFNYSLSEVLGDLKDSPFSRGGNILIGNSASFSNNHLYVLEFLKKMELGHDIKMIMPVSYGGKPKYIKAIIEEYSRCFPGKVKFLKDYMPLHEYNRMFTSINACILSAWRQESIGTIIMCLYMGIKVFMSNRSPLYNWLIECGFIIFEIENATGSSLTEPLDYDTQQHNRDLVLQRYNEKQIAENLSKNIF